jgi:predicted dehydrogenase
LGKETLRIAVVGLGKMGLLHASILNVLPDVQLVAVCEKSAVTRKLFKKVFNGIPIVKDIKDFSDLDLDAIYITTPIPSHFSIAKMVYQERIARHLFVEKTLASNYPESKELCELVNRHGGVNMVGYLRRFMVTFMKAKELLTQNVIGEPGSFAVNAFSSDFYGISENPKTSIARGGVLRDLGSHAIDIALWFFGNIQVSSAKIKSLTGAGSEDSVNFTVQRESDVLQGEFSVSWCMEGYRMPEVVLSIKGSRGVIEVNDDKVSLCLSNGKVSTWYRPNLNDNVLFWLGGPEYCREDAYFIKSVRENSTAEPSFDTASKVDLLVDEIEQRAEKDG